tara:strand:- start:363 stop:521 length:159 start_codon:yes stop_codon:yes gene_type:complete
MDIEMSILIHTDIDRNIETDSVLDINIDTDTDIDRDTDVQKKKRKNTETIET